MNIFIPVFFNAQLGGLQSNVISQIKALLNAKYTCTVMCKPGIFAESLKKLGVKTLETSFDFFDSDVQLAKAAGPFDLVHAHPFSSRMVGLSVAKQMKIPFILTFHGTYLDSLEEYYTDVDIIFAVCPAIREYLIKSSNFPPERILVVPNGVDTNIFYPSAGQGARLDLAEFVKKIKRSLFFPIRKKPLNSQDTRLAKRFPALDQFPLDGNFRRIFFASRMDKDKQFILDVIKETWHNINFRKAYNLQWIVAGDGVLLEEMEKAAQELNAAAKKKLVIFLGWQEESSLAILSSNCHLAIAPGRSALEAMACGTPVIAVGSKGYIGLINKENVFKGVYTNFGGFGNKHEDYEPGTMYQDIDRVIYDDYLLSELGELSKSVISCFFKQSKIDIKLLNFYEVTRQLTPRSIAKSQHLSEINIPVFHFASRDKPESLNDSWFLSEKNKRVDISLTEDQGLIVDFTIPAGDKIYFKTGTGHFSTPPSPIDNYRIIAKHFYELTTDIQVDKGSPEALLWIIEYSDTKRLTHTYIKLQRGNNILSFITSQDTTCCRVAFRFAGDGIIKISPLKLYTKKHIAVPKL
jgi:glycosyltransferase involved in cell wall biosynthesis